MAHAKDELAARFYQHWKFRPTPGNLLLLIIPMEVVRASLAAAGLTASDDVERGADRLLTKVQERKHDIERAITMSGDPEGRMRDLLANIEESLRTLEAELRDKDGKRK